MKLFQISAGNVPPATASPWYSVSIGLQRVRVADPDRDDELRRVADEPGVAVVLGRARSCRRPARPSESCACRPVPAGDDVCSR